MPPHPTIETCGEGCLASGDTPKGPRRSSRKAGYVVCSQNFALEPKVVWDCKSPDSAEICQAGKRISPGELFDAPAGADCKDVTGVQPDTPPLVRIWLKEKNGRGEDELDAEVSGKGSRVRVSLRRLNGPIKRQRRSFSVASSGPLACPSLEHTNSLPSKGSAIDSELFGKLAAVVGIDQGVCNPAAKTPCRQRSCSPINSLMASPVGDNTDLSCWSEQSSFDEAAVSTLQLVAADERVHHASTASGTLTKLPPPFVANLVRTPRATLSSAAALGTSLTARTAQRVCKPLPTSAGCADVRACAAPVTQAASATHAGNGGSSYAAAAGAEYMSKNTFASTCVSAQTRKPLQSLQLTAPRRSPRVAVAKVARMCEQDERTVAPPLVNGARRQLCLPAASRSSDSSIASGTCPPGATKPYVKKEHSASHEVLLQQQLAMPAQRSGVLSVSGPVETRVPSGCATAGQLQAAPCQDLLGAKGTSATDRSRVVPHPGKYGGAGTTADEAPNSMQQPGNINKVVNLWDSRHRSDALLKNCVTGTQSLAKSPRSAAPSSRCDQSSAAAGAPCSDEVSSQSSDSGGASRYSREEIARKKQEALERRMRKAAALVTKEVLPEKGPNVQAAVPSSTGTSNNISTRGCASRCSSEEIERKKKEALERKMKKTNNAAPPSFMTQTGAVGVGVIGISSVTGKGMCSF